MTDEKKAEVIDTFISIGEKLLKGNKHFHLEPILARDTIQAIKELEKEYAELKEQNESLSKRILEQQTTIGNLTDMVDKMKCCGNCNEPCWNIPIVRKYECLNNNYSLWELAE